MALVVGPLAVVVGLVVVFFVMRRKSVEKKSMYSARRSQIEHKVRAARQRTLTPHGRAKPQEQSIPAASATFATQAPQATVAWETPAYEAPPVAPPSAAPPPPPAPDAAPAPAPWDVPAAASGPAPTFDYPPAPAQQPAYEPPAYEPPAPEPFRPAPEPTPMAPSEPAWTPAPAPAMEPAAQLEPATATATSTSAGGWSIVSTAKETADEPQPDGKKKKKGKGGDADSTGQWQLASGNAPGDEADEPEVKRSSGTLVAVVQYALFVIGLMVVLVGVLVMVANAHV